MIAVPGVAHAEKRVELVIGNGAYDSVTPLAKGCSANISLWLFSEMFKSHNI